MSAYVRQLEMVTAGVETHTAVLRQMRESATMSLLRVALEHDKTQLPALARYDAFAGSYISALEAYLAGEFTGDSLTMEEMSSDYEASRRALVDEITKTTN